MAKKFWMTGLVPATFTPMHEDGRLNPGAVAPLVQPKLTVPASNASTKFCVREPSTGDCEPMCGPPIPSPAVPLKK